MWARIAGLTAAVLLSACGSAPKKFYQSDGPPAARDIPAQLAQTPDATPRIEPFHRYANRPYSALGRTYTPQTTDAPLKQRGLASWYGKQFHGNKTASGERYDMFAMTAAHPTLPLPSYARVTNPKNGKQIIVRVNDRGPFLHGRIIDLSYAAAVKLGVAGGVSEVEVERITHADIRAGRPVETPAAPDLFVAPVVPVPPPPASIALPNEALTGGPWSIQLGAFEVAANAQALRDRMALLLNAAEASDLPPEARSPRVQLNGNLYHVLIGHFAERNAAQQLAERVSKVLDRETVLFLQK